MLFNVAFIKQHIGVRIRHFSLAFGVLQKHTERTIDALVLQIYLLQTFFVPLLFINFVTL